MTTFQALVLGLVQGASEFLPISSTAHLRIVPALAGWRDPGAALTAVLQLGTLLAVLSFFLRDLLRMAKAAAGALVDPSRRRNPDARMLAYMVAGTVPIGICGLLLKDAVEGSFRSLWIVASALLVVGLALLVVERKASHSRDFPDIGWMDAMVIGGAQTLALVPGVSRSGITLLAAMAVGLKRDAAARFSFLLSVPAIGAAGVFELGDVLRSQEISTGPLLAGLAAAAAAGYLSIAWLLKFLQTRSTLPFVVYRVALGAALLLALAAGALRAA